MSWEVNGANIVEATVECPPTGAWWADVTVDRAVDSGSRATCDFGGTVWSGYVSSSDQDGGQWRLRIVGGNGGLGTEINARFIRGAAVTPTLVAEQIARRGGETIANPPPNGPTSYQVFDGTVGKELTRLADRMSTQWRMTLDGRIVFDDEFEPVNAPGELLTSTEQARRYSCETFGFRGPVEVDGYRAQHLRWHVDKEGASLLLLRVSLAVDPIDRKERAPRLGTVLLQVGGECEIQLDDGWALSRVPLWVGLPGVSVQVLPGVRVVVMWPSDRPNEPIAMLAPQSSIPALSTDIATNEMRVGPVPLAATNPVVRVGDIITLTQNIQKGATGSQATDGPYIVQLAINQDTKLSAALKVGDGIG